MGKGQRKDVAEGPTFGGVLSPGDKPLRFSGAPYLGWLGADRRSSHLGADPAIAVESASPHSSTSVTRFDGRLDPCANARIAAIELHGGGDVLAILGSDTARYVSGQPGRLLGVDDPPLLPGERRHVAPGTSNCCAIRRNDATLIVWHATTRRVVRQSGNRRVSLGTNRSPSHTEMWRQRPFDHRADSDSYCAAWVLKKVARRSTAAADSGSPAEINTGQTWTPCRHDSKATSTPAVVAASRMRVASS